MNINSVRQGAGLYKSQEQQQVDRKKDDEKLESNLSTQRKSDRLEISNQARQLTNVQQRIEQGFYDRPEVIRQVARKINDNIKNSKN